MYDKDKIKDQLTLDMIIELVRDFGGDPKITNFGFISATICHNHPGEGSHKLYYYENTKLFRCYTGCDSTFDIFELCCKVHELNTMKPWSLVDAMNYVVKRFGFSGGSSDSPEDFGGLLDVPIFQRYEHLLEPKADTLVEQLKEYDSTILKRLSYPVIKTWLDEGISKEVMRQNLIGYYPPTEQITIPHFDKDGRFIGLRGRFLGKQDAELYGKYRPMIINGVMYNHALGLNLYNFNNSRKNIQNIKKAIVVEGEKSCLLYQSYFGAENDISVACCGSSISSYQMQLLIDDDVEEVIIAFDKQFQEKGDNEFKHLVKNLKSIKQKYGNYVNVSFIFDKTDLLGYKDSPLDRGKEKFIELFKSRVIL